jgi:Mn-dependent DtxR family transcriptional regulator
METVLTQSTQDYLKHIFELTEGGGAASTNDLASLLGLSLPRSPAWCKN